MAFSTWVEFTEENIAAVPTESGVYSLAQGVNIIYYGRANGGSATLQSRLRDHRCGSEGPCTAAATAFAFEVTKYPASREAELLKAYRWTHGQNPQGNQPATAPMAAATA